VVTAVQSPSQASGAPAGARGKTAGAKSAGGPAADAAPESDSESDAFARIGSAQFKNGKLDVRLGRKVKTVKPRFTIKGGLDRISIVNPVTVVMVTIADTGKVSEVRVIRSSGSNELDLPWVLAVYKWWFEPATDAAGKATSDVVQLTLGVIDAEY
jgi:TonB family protein